MDFNQRQLLAAQGYADLGMFDDALREIDALPAETRDRSDVVEARIHILMRARHWEEALVISENLCRTEPGSGTGFVHAAFCLHELGRTQDARKRLLSGPAELRSHAIFHYNLACYDAVLGNPDEALHSLRRSFLIDDKFREFARIDPDLECLRGLM